MTVWILSANSSMYNHKLAFDELGYIDWKQTRNFSVGDIIYIYCTKPISRIQYKTRVIAVNQHIEDICNDFIYWHKSEMRQYSVADKFVRIELISYVDEKSLDLSILREHGLIYPPQSPAKMNPKLLTYVDHFFDRSKT